MVLNVGTGTEMVFLHSLSIIFAASKVHKKKKNSKSNRMHTLCAFVFVCIESVWVVNCRLWLPIDVNVWSWWNLGYSFMIFVEWFSKWLNCWINTKRIVYGFDAQHKLIISFVLLAFPPFVSLSLRRSGSYFCDCGTPSVSHKFTRTDRLRGHKKCFILFLFGLHTHTYDEPRERTSQRSQWCFVVYVQFSIVFSVHFVFTL